uniref:FGFR1 oncogene partner 2 homolog n=1 Tax=Arion vulgaris TaxID=1028688 RepID=A0A0B6YUI6_9EUPU
MALSVEKLLMDAHTLVIHLRDHDVLADNIIAATQALYNKVEAMKQYQDDITELNEIAKHRPRSTLVLGIAQENRQIRELQQENRELQAALEEHQSALELIMQKYREHTVKLLQSNRLEKAMQEREAVDKDSMCHLMDKIDEMAGVMQKAIEVDETVGCADKERLSRLEIENKALREMLEICTTSKERIMYGDVKKELKEEDRQDDDDTTDTECDSSVLASTDKKEGEEEKEVEDKTMKKSTDSVGKDSASPTSKDSTPVNSKESSTVVGNAKSVGASKSAVDIRKGKTTVANKGESSVKKTMSSTSPGVKKDLPTIKKSPSIEVKKDLKGKATPKSAGKK